MSTSDDRGKANTRNKERKKERKRGRQRKGEREGGERERESWLVWGDPETEVVEKKKEKKR